MPTRRQAAQTPDTDTDSDGSRVGFHDDLEPGQPSPAELELREQEIEADTLVTRTRDILLRTPGQVMTLKLYRLKDDGTRVFCANYSPEKFASGDLEMIRAEWGAGKFEIRMIGPKGLADRPRDFEIAEKIGSSVTPVSASTQNPEMIAILRTLAESQAAILRAVSDKPAPVDTLEQFKSFASIMRDLTPAQNPAPTPPVQSASSMLADLMGAMKALKEVAAETAPPEPSNDPMAMLPSILGIVKETMAQRGGNNVPMLPAPFPEIQTPASVAAVNPAQNVNPEPESENMNITASLVMRGLLQKLINMAVEKKSPEEGGQFIYEKIPDEFVQYLDLPNWFEIIESFEPAVTPHKEWLTKAKEFADIEFAKPEDSAD